MKIPRRSFVQLAKEIDYKKNSLGGNYLSEKLDGQRGLWDGGITRGMPIRAVPWANVEKEDRLVEDRISTGLWSRYGHPIQAPDWWLDNLPNIPLDGELYLGRGRGTVIASFCKNGSSIAGVISFVKLGSLISPSSKSSEYAGASKTR